MFSNLKASYIAANLFVHFTSHTYETETTTSYFCTPFCSAISVDRESHHYPMKMAQKIESDFFWYKSGRLRFYDEDNARCGAEQEGQRK